MSDENFDIALAALVGRFRKHDGTPTIQEIEQVARQLAAVLDYQGPIDPLVNEARANISHRLGEGVSLVLREAGHDPDWVNKREIEWSYSRSYDRYLREDGYPAKVVDTLMQVSLKIAGHLQDPAEEGKWDRRGLVIGHVQSGKTANYLGLVARAADAGYKFIVVVAGVHNNLRMQTQERVDAGFVGEVSDRARRARLEAEGKPIYVGVGRYPGHKRPVALTSTLQDFNKRQADTLRGSLRDWSKPVVVVIKKNVTTLRALSKWLSDFNKEAGQDQIADVPMLFIDDEADNASINTNKPELDPARTNALIREILALFHKSSYVGYTATPFANIFINPDTKDEMLQDDLFPKHFIHCLDAPTNYFGAEKIFLASEGERYLRRIRDCEDVLPLRHPKTAQIDELPVSLKCAIRTFIIARALRSLRGQTTKHCSMLINVSRFVEVQKEVRRVVDLYRISLANAVEACGALPEKLALRDLHMRDLKETFEQEYAEAGYVWHQVQAALHQAASSVRTAVVNSKSDEGLNYAEAADRGEALNVIAIGGLSLSRGLTLEGLTISYMYRNTRMYDTLLQMGRWFGYRPNYEDLCRVWLSDDSIDWYEHIADATEELRDSIKEMNRVKATPETFGLMVRSHPDALTVTAANKMRDAESRTVSVSYDGRLLETHILSTDEAVNAANLTLMKQLHLQLLSQHLPRRVRELPERDWHEVWREVPVSVIKQFLAGFSVHRDLAGRFMSARDYVDQIAGRFGAWDIAFLSLKRPDQGSEKLDDFDMAIQSRTAGHDNGVLRTPPSGDGYMVTSKQRVAGKGDERIGLFKPEIDEALRIARESDSALRDKSADDISDRYFRNVAVRGRPLLMLHLLNLNAPSEDETKGQRLLSAVPALGLSFPHTGDYKTVEYVLGRVMLRQLSLDFDSPDDEEDFDREDAA